MPNLQDLKVVREFSWNLILALIVINTSVFSYGFDNSVFSGIQAMDAYEKRFGSLNHKTGKWGFSTEHLSYLNSFGLPAKCVGALLGMLVAENFGRRPAYIAMQFILIAGIAVSYSASYYGAALAGRILVQSFVGWDNFLAPMFLAEISPAHFRGAIVVIYVFSHFFGSLICTFVTLATSHYAGDASWQRPIAAMFAFPFFVLSFCYFIPESPRWLVRKGRQEQAVKTLNWIHGAGTGYNAESDADMLKMAVERDTEMKGRWADFLKRPNKRRIGIALCVAAFNQLTGQSFMSQYGAIFVKSLGTMSPFTFRAISAGIATMGPVILFTLVDIVGRRPFYLIAGSMCAASLLACGGLGVGSVSDGDKAGIIAVCILFTFFYSMSFGAVGAVTAAEVAQLRLRDKNAFLVYCTQFICDFIVTFTLPYLLNAGYANLQSKVGFIYGAIGLIAVTWAFFCLPELKGRSLEELDIMWDEGIPARKFRKWRAPAWMFNTQNSDVEDHKGSEDNDDDKTRKNANVYVRNAE